MKSLVIRFAAVAGLVLFLADVAPAQHHGPPKRNKSNPEQPAQYP